MGFLDRFKSLFSRPPSDSGGGVPQGETVPADPAPEVETTPPSVEEQAETTAGDPPVEPSVGPSDEATIKTEGSVTSEAKVDQPVTTGEVESPLGEQEPETVAPPLETEQSEPLTETKAVDTPEAPEVTSPSPSPTKTEI